LTASTSTHRRWRICGSWQGIEASVKCRHEKGELKARLFYRSRLAPTEQQTHYQAETGRDGYGLPRMTTDVGFSRFNRGFGPVTNTGYRVPGLLKFLGDLP